MFYVKGKTGSYQILYLGISLLELLQSDALIPRSDSPIPGILVLKNNGQGRSEGSDPCSSLLPSQGFDWAPIRKAGTAQRARTLWSTKISSEYHQATLFRQPGEVSIWSLKETWWGSCSELGQLMWHQLWQGRCWQQWLGCGIVLTEVESADTRAAGRSLHELSQI